MSQSMRVWTTTPRAGEDGLEDSLDVVVTFDATVRVPGSAPTQHSPGWPPEFDLVMTGAEIDLPESDSSDRTLSEEEMARVRAWFDESGDPHEVAHCKWDSTPPCRED